ncbi:hypothetical protein BLNAU_7083 [Blattamonas nauphoetae]|uniref:Uncharacterized protein n=1 Tax=Blattamonas nauphoetae TaxID=2049346 RepID=A0ABQ9Y2D5_9EUKA|nr:hypothetical protein BLNAU_7083 [Blattamonas nauphoetae]
MAISPLTPIHAWDSTEEGTVQYPAHPRRQKNHRKKQKNADPDHGAQNRGKSTQNEGKELLSPDSREVDRSMISPSISPAAHQDDVERKKQKHPLRLQQAQAQTLKLDEVRQYVILLNELLSKAYSRHANCTPCSPSARHPFLRNSTHNSKIRSPRRASCSS